MNNGTYGGLAGQSRRVRHRNRADRLHTQHLIEEYLEPEDEPARDIPIRGRSDFLPTVAGGLVETMVESGAQMELPLEETRDEPKTAAAEAAPTVAKSEQSHDGGRHDPRQSTAKSDDTVRWGSQDVTAFSETRGSDFEVGKFLYGCLIGGSAAAFVLVVLQLVI